MVGGAGAEECLPDMSMSGALFTGKSGFGKWGGVQARQVAPETGGNGPTADAAFTQVCL